MGRPRSPYWAPFTEVECDTAHPTAKCNYCTWSQPSAQPGRHLLPHIKVCTTMPDHVKYAAVKDFITCDDAEPRPRKRPARIDADAGEYTSCTCPCFCGTRSTTASLPRDRRIQLQLALARFIYATGVAFRIVENEFFRLFVRMMCPNFVFPSRGRIGGDLLNKVYEEEKELVIQDLKMASFLSLATDGWTNPNREGIVNFVISSPLMKPVYWSSTCTGSESVTAKYMFKELDTVIVGLDQVLGASKVTSLLSDNCSVMQAMHDILEVKRPGVIANGCAPHVLNLIVQDMHKFEFFTNVINNCTQVVKFIRNRSALLAKFRHIQLSSDGEHKWCLKLRAPTRWYSVRECIRSVLENKDTVMAVFAISDLHKRYETNAKSKKKLVDTLKIVRDPAFWENAGTAHKFIDPVVKALAHLEKDSASSALVYELFNDLLKNPVYDASQGPLDEKEAREALHYIIDDRWKFLHTDAMAVAFLLDQNKSTVDFIDDDYFKALKATAKLAKRAGLLCGLTADEFEKLVRRFANEKIMWTEDVRASYLTVSPYEWWLHTKKYPQIKPLALRIFSISTSAATCERSWSAHNYLHSNVRNRLKAATVDKLVFVYTNMGRHNDKRQDDIFFLTEAGATHEEIDSTADASVDSGDGLVPLSPSNENTSTQDASQRPRSLDATQDPHSPSIDFSYDHECRL